MGYYTQIYVNLKVKKQKIEEFKSKIEELKEKVRNGTLPDGNWFWWYEDISVAEDGSIEFTDYTRKWYEEERFYNFIKDYVEQGYIEGYGEEFGDIWRVVFDGKGHFKWQEAVFQDVKGLVVQ